MTATGGDARGPGVKVTLKPRNETNTAVHRHVGCGRDPQGLHKKFARLTPYGQVSVNKWLT